MSKPECVGLASNWQEVYPVSAEYIGALLREVEGRARTLERRAARNLCALPLTLARAQRLARNVYVWASWRRKTSARKSLAFAHANAVYKLGLLAEVALPFGWSDSGAWEGYRDSLSNRAVEVQRRVARRNEYRQSETDIDPGAYSGATQ